MRVYLFTVPRAPNLMYEKLLFTRKKLSYGTSFHQEENLEILILLINFLFWSSGRSIYEDFAHLKVNLNSKLTNFESLELV